MIRVLVVDDSKVITTLLTSIINKEADMEVIGCASNGKEAVAMAYDLKPDLITMDIRMPVMDGFAATRLIMANQPTPIVIVSASVNSDDMQITFRAIEEGALAVIEKPCSASNSSTNGNLDELIPTIRAMSEVKVVGRRFRVPSSASVQQEEHQPIDPQHPNYEIIGIGCSTGGPMAMQQLLSGLPANLSVPVVVSQHIAHSFMDGLVTWLRSQTMLDVRIAEQNEQLNPSTIYFAPEDYHLTVFRGTAHKLFCRLTQTPPVNGFRPSASVSLKSLAEICGDRAIGVLLTGMGNDGADGLLAIHSSGGHTIVQDEESAVIYGMPGSALALNAVTNVVSLREMAIYLSELVAK